MNSAVARPFMSRSRIDGVLRYRGIGAPEHLQDTLQQCRTNIDAVPASQVDQTVERGVRGELRHGFYALQGTTGHISQPALADR